jgi:hypothetical protein
MRYGIVWIKPPVCQNVDEAAKAAPRLQKAKTLDPLESTTKARESRGLGKPISS